MDLATVYCERFVSTVVHLHLVAREIGEVRCKDLYGMDETRCLPSDQGTHVVGGRRAKTHHKQGGANHKNMTAIVTICAYGTILKRKTVSVD
ncbi:hypothetical protein BYT27DRAFT_7205780 [Phlegmacium glaucopus]|nr:hypothetical protein BYT27DRAFT_7205780 [Phlegmacium glaucopus]